MCNITPTFDPQNEISWKHWTVLSFAAQMSYIFLDGDNFKPRRRMSSVFNINLELKVISLKRNGAY